MATAIEHGFVGAMLTGAVCAIASHFVNPTPAVIQVSPVPQKIFQANDTGEIFIDIETGCEYVRAGAGGVSIRYTKAGLPYCPKNLK